MSSGAYQGRIFGMLRRAVLGVLGTAQRLFLALPGLMRRCQQCLHDFAVVLRLGGAPGRSVQRRPLSKGHPRLGEVDASLQHLPHGHQIARTHLAAEDDRRLRIDHWGAAPTLASRTSYAQGRYEGKMALPPPWKVVSPEGMVHFVADKRALSALSKAHGLRNEYMRNTLGFGTPKREHGGWQPLASSLPEAWPEEGAKWLLHEPSGLMLVVPSGALTFLENFDAYRPRLTDGVEPPHLRSLQKLLKGVRAPVPFLRVRVLTARIFFVTGDRGDRKRLEVDRRAAACGSHLQGGAAFV